MRAVKFELVKANDPFELYQAVQKFLTNGYDLQGTLTTSDVSRIGQWVVGLPAMSDYILVVADDLEAYENQATALLDQGWDFWYGPQRWGGKILQWMQREKAEPVRLEKHSRVIHAVPVLTILGGARSIPFPLIQG